MNKYYLAIEENNEIYNLFIIGYTKDGGYFIKFLTTEDDYYLVHKLQIPKDFLRKVGEYTIEVNQETSWFASKNPKLTHHVDGNVQVSEYGIVSGFYKLTGKPKGVYNKSMSLICRDNDGGPCLSVTAWGLPKLVTIRGRQKKSRVITEQNFFTLNQPFKNLAPRENEDYSYCIEGYYLPKTALNFLDVSRGVIWFHHPIYHIVPLTYIPSPEHNPGFLAFSCTKFILGEGFKEHDFGFSFGGGVGKFEENKDYVDDIRIFYPGDKSVKNYKVNKSIDLTWFKRIKFYFDDWLSKILS